MLITKLKNILDQAMEIASPGVECIIDTDELIVYKKDWIDSPFIDVIGFAPFNISDDASNWKNVESLFLNSISKELYGPLSMSIEPSLAFVYNKKLINQIFKIIVEIERNDMHCRKFVIPFENDIIDHVMRLPIASLSNSRMNNFLPFSAHRTLQGIGLRPNCVEAILKRENMNVILKNLPDAIKTDTDTTHVSSYISAHDNSILPSVRLKMLSIEGFRAYGQKQEFDLDADLVVIAGPNGLGKTSFFDAIDYAVTGTIKRFAKKQEVIPNLTYSSNLNVSLEFSVEGPEGKEHILINRNSLELSDVAINGTNSNRKNVLMKITGANINEGVEQLVQLFRASHLASQSQAALTENIRKDSSIPTNVLGRMLSLEDYVQGISKLERTLSLCDRNSKDIDAKIRAIKNDLIVIDVELQELNKYQVLNTNDILENEDSIYLSFVSIGSSLGVDILNSDSDSLKTRLNNLRSSIDAFKSKTQQSLTSYRELLNCMDQREKKIIDHKSLSLKLSEVIKVNDAILSKLDLLKKEIFEGERSKDRYKRIISENKKRIEILNLLKGKVANINELKVKVNTMSNEVIDKEIDIERLQSISISKIETIKVIKLEISILEGEYDKQKQIISSLKFVEEQIPIYLETLQKIALNEKLILQSREQSDEIKCEASQKQVLLLELNTNISQIQVKIKNEKKDYNDLTYAIDQLKKFVKNSECPFCGHNHNSQNNLIDLVEQKFGVEPDSLKKLNDEFAKQQDEKKAIEDLVISLKLQLENTEKNLVTHSDELKGLKLKIQHIEQLFSESEYVYNEEMVEAVKVQLVNEKQKLILIATEVDVKAKSCEVLQKNHNELKLSIDSIHEKLALIQAQLKQDQKKYNVFLDELINNGLSSEVSLTEIDDAINIASEKEKSAILQEDQYIRILEPLYENLKELENHNKSNAKEINSIGPMIDILEEQLKYINNKIIDINRSTDVCLSEVISMIEAQQNKISELNKLREEVLNAEIISDSKEKSARMVKLLDKRTSLVEAKDMLVHESDKANNQKTILNIIKDRLSLIQDTSLSSYFDAVGPIANLIQQRLRPAYGFGQMHIESGNETGVLIKVESMDTNTYLVPSDYFSEAQIGILGLSIFFSVSFTQNWSGLRTIMLDDPVLHFDDLNLYAFADLLRSWITSTPLNERPQIIVSTCDDRLLRIMQRKFSPLKDEGRAKFYIFRSIDKEGPIVEVC